MKLYFAPLTCSLSPHIILRELGISFELIRVNNRTKRTADNRDFREINPKGYVAALVLDSDEVLTEGPAIIQYLADLCPEARLAPPHGSWERIRMQELLSFLSSELHSGVAPLFNQALPDSVRDIFRERLFNRLNYLCEFIGHKPYLVGQFSIADAYLFSILLWLPIFQVDIEDWPVLSQFMARMHTRPAVKTAMAAEDATSPI
ncbi:glutathione transferase GstA [Photobacterium sp. TY1-4]|uniref:glutathione transferase GstA n=1 Tax=Photobacterium sp. TY1-4 TaxID=2899122 RepID=UPI0021BFA004|nr:glutathione transferase GstA [Photobacterium sp. TY1-4]UXI03675.1 glutathione transferase GstA [Photobacterium sp. TY1-4]